LATHPFFFLPDASRQTASRLGLGLTSSNNRHTGSGLNDDVRRLNDSVSLRMSLNTKQCSDWPPRPGTGRPARIDSAQLGFPAS